VEEGWKEEKWEGSRPMPAPLPCIYYVKGPQAATFLLSKSSCMLTLRFVCVCVCVCERESKREKRVGVRERERERGRESE